MLSNIFYFPHPVNEIAARLVAGMVLVLTMAILLGAGSWLVFLLTYGFLARVLTGPKLSPMGLIATRVLVPLFGNPNRPVAGPPKRFAQGIGFVLSFISLIILYGPGPPMFAKTLLSLVAVFAFLECSIGFCMGCLIFGRLMRLGLIPRDICIKCNSIGPPTQS